jgi:hypothetical protein
MFFYALLIAIPQLPLQFSTIMYMPLMTPWHVGPTCVTDSGIFGIVEIRNGI